ncbi:MAG: MFS transporter [Planctomycetales bacterium]|nr:MFS transporter [Planctomycetales bacterium]
MTSERNNVVFRRDALAWCCYDWANSGYTTLIITVFVVYFQRVVFAAEHWGTAGAVVWAWAVSASMLIGAILSPILGALTDLRASKRHWLAITASVGGLACIVLAVLPLNAVWWITASFIVANLSLELSLTVYNGFLPEIAQDDEMNRISAAGMGWGYVGGGLALLLGMATIQFGDALGLQELSSRLRVCIAATGIWWIVFTVPTIVVLRDKRRHDRKSIPLLETASTAFGDAIGTFRQLRQFKVLALFLLAFLFFNDGVQTVISQSSTFALQEVSFTESELLGVILMVQFLAAPGAIAVGKLSDVFGQKNTLVCCLVVWIGLLFSAWFIHTKIAYWCMAAVVALVLGGTQSVSRAIMGVLTPEEHAAKFFGFFNMSGKATSFMGTLVFGLIVAMTGSSRRAIVTLIAFFAIGLVIILCLRLPRVIANSGDSSQVKRSGHYANAD